MNEEQRKKYLDKYFTDKGVKALENRLKNLVQLYLRNNKYPFKARMVGFTTLEVHSKEHLEGMIDELKQLVIIPKINVEVQNGN